MGNVIIIAKKEFTDLVSNKIVLIIMAVFLFLIVKSAYEYYDALSNNLLLIENLSSNILMGIWSILTNYGSLVGVVVGFSLISSEKRGSALNVLLAKPLYRDSIINGKFLGALGFILCTFCIATILFISALLIAIGNSIISILPDILSRILVVFVLSVMYVMIFLSLSMLIALIIKDQAFALISSIIMIAVCELISSASFTGNIYYFLSGSLVFREDAFARFISELSPGGVSLILTNSNFFNPDISLWNAFSLVEFEIIRLILYMVITITLCYIVFIRRDVT